MKSQIFLPTKILIGISLGFLAGAIPYKANALDFTPDPSRILSDPAYLPEKGVVEGTTSYSYADRTGDQYNNLGVLRDSFTVNTNTLSQSLAYGLTRELTLRANVAYRSQREKDAYTTGTEFSYDSRGLEDPAIGLVWRALDQDAHWISWDLIGTYSPSLIDAKEASTTQTGTVAWGGSATTFGTAVSHKTRDFTIYVGANATYLASRDVLRLTNNTTLTYDSGWQYSLGLNTQTRFTDRFAITVGATETLNNGVNGLNDTTLVAFKWKPTNVTAVNTALNYDIYPNRFVAALTYSYNAFSNGSTQYPTQPSSNLSTKNESSNVIGARLQYVFN